MTNDKPSKDPRQDKQTNKHHREGSDYPKNPFMAGLVEVQFRSASDSGLLNHLFKTPEMKKPSKDWSSSFVKVLFENRMESWRPSFPLKYSWSKKTDEEARKFYSASGRDRLVTLRFPNNADVSTIAKRLQELPFVARANPVARIKPAGPIDDEFFGLNDQIVSIIGTAGAFENQWYAFRCNLPAALETARGTNVIIAAIDWGFDIFHDDYQSAIALTKNIFNDDDDVTVGSLFHGTAAIGLAGARANSVGIVGFAPESILWAVQAGEESDTDGEPNYEDWAEAIDFVREESATQRKVIYLEIQTETEGNVECIQVMNNAIAAAVEAGVVVCVPAGNLPGDAGLDDNGIVIPETGSVLVGATLYDPVHNFVGGKSGNRIVVYAPGDMLHDVTCRPVNDYTNSFGGTSGAVAKVAGAVALMLEIDNSLTPEDVCDILRSSSISVLNDSSVEIGKLLDCAHALSEVQARKETHYSCRRSSEPVHAY